MQRFAWWLIRTPRLNDNIICNEKNIQSVFDSCHFTQHSFDDLCSGQTVDKYNAHFWISCHAWNMNSIFLVDVKHSKKYEPSPIAWKTISRFNDYARKNERKFACKNLAYVFAHTLSLSVLLSLLSPSLSHTSHSAIIQYI